MALILIPFKKLKHNKYSFNAKLNVLPRAYNCIIRVPMKLGREFDKSNVKVIIQILDENGNVKKEY